MFKHGIIILPLFYDIDAYPQFLNNFNKIAVGWCQHLQIEQLAMDKVNGDATTNAVVVGEFNCASQKKVARTTHIIIDSF